MDGSIEMRYKEDGQKRKPYCSIPVIFFAGIGAEHVAHPRGEARIIVIEKEDGI